ncbi:MULTISPECIES: DUF2922 domain-containing protein [Desulfitobacterium]|uniref:DUF2922 domain-containing protein n=1 Tax=Desulfitobacterium dehalogenans (strain ATCC 51507 / DSM 9161 / JW/IU-DC1) TaxID=756499 RepID=I4A3Q1_DESDJ|nr:MULTISPECIES: DUF2922 domain-containing protein [Desulfitobacterium]AFL98585.1 Protein of unknown function (DUF2922) [Desulfitobacterium dehalogenans ATCC 51507]
MPISTNRVLRLTFGTTGGGTASITLADPRSDLNPSEVLEAMNTVISRNIFVSPAGTLTGVRDVKVIDTTTNDLFDPQQA